MTRMHLLNRPGLAAIAAATAFISTSAPAQEAAPAPSEPTPIVADQPLPAEPSTTAAPTTTADPLAPAATPTTTAQPRASRPTSAAAAPARRAPAPVRTAAPAEAPSTAAVAPPVDATQSQVDPAMVAPVPETVAAEPVAPAENSLLDNDALPIVGAAGLGLLALAGAGAAMRRRRRREDGEMSVEPTWHEPVMSRPAAEPAMAAPLAAASAAAPLARPAFSWDSASDKPAPSRQSAPVNRIEAAKRGPTPDNPSLSLKKRLKRAAFFDQRDRQIAAGRAAPVPSTAGLPDRMAQTVSNPGRPVTKPAHGMSMSFGKTFQPA